MERHKVLLRDNFKIGKSLRLSCDLTIEGPYVMIKMLFQRHLIIRSLSLRDRHFEVVYGGRLKAYLSPPKLHRDM
jgi:hypothetical protein